MGLCTWPLLPVQVRMACDTSLVAVVPNASLALVIHVLLRLHFCNPHMFSQDFVRGPANVRPHGTGVSRNGFRWHNFDALVSAQTYMMILFEIVFEMLATSVAMVPHRGGEPKQPSCWHARTSNCLGFWRDVCARASPTAAGQDQRASQPQVFAGRCSSTVLWITKKYTSTLAIRVL